MECSRPSTTRTRSSPCRSIVELLDSSPHLVIPPKRDVVGRTGWALLSTCPCQSKQPATSSLAFSRWRLTSWCRPTTLSDGIKGDPVVGAEGWNLTPEGLAECVRLTANRCGGHSRSSGGAKPRKLLVLGAGGYHPTNAARTFLLSTAAACEGARPGMLWDELPKDVPQHEFFGRYGPEFQLISQGLGVDLAGGQQTSKAANTNCASSCIDPRTHDDRKKAFDDAKKSVNVCALFVQSKRESLASVSFNSKADDEFKGKEGDWEIGPRKKKASSGGGKRRKRNRKAAAGGGAAAAADASSLASNSRSTATSSAASEEENY